MARLHDRGDKGRGAVLQEDLPELDHAVGCGAVHERVRHVDRAHLIVGAPAADREALILSEHYVRVQP